MVAAHIADRLNRAAAEDRSSDVHGVTGPGWARGAPARGRLAVWIAVGLIIAETGVLPDDALAVLRAAAYSAGRSLDEIAGDVVTGNTGVRDLLSQ